MSISVAPWAPSVFEALLVGLKCDKVKVRMYAAAALKMPHNRTAFGLMYESVWKTLVHVLFSLPFYEPRAQYPKMAYPPHYGLAASSQGTRDVAGVHAHLTYTLLHLIAIASEDDMQALHISLREASILGDNMQVWSSFAKSTFIQAAGEDDKMLVNGMDDIALEVAGIILRLCISLSLSIIFRMRSLSLHIFSFVIFLA